MKRLWGTPNNEQRKLNTERSLAQARSMFRVRCSLFYVLLLTLLAVFLFLIYEIAVAQEPKVRTSLATNDTIWVGQKATVIVELLAPGIFASAASFDLP